MRLWLLAAKPDCCYKEQQQRECLLENAEAHILAVRHRRVSPRGSPAEHRAPPSGRDRKGNEKRCVFSGAKATQEQEVIQHPEG